jgi:hypothetical protein
MPFLFNNNITLFSFDNNLKKCRIEIENGIRVINIRWEQNILHMSYFILYRNKNMRIHYEQISDYYSEKETLFNMKYVASYAIRTTRHGTCIREKLMGIEFVMETYCSKPNAYIHHFMKN